MEKRCSFLAFFLPLLWAFTTFANYFLIHYTVQKGDSLYSIALDFSVSPSVILDWNPDITHSRLLPGTVILIPQPSGYLYTVQRNDTLEIIARRFFTTPQLIREANGLRSDRIQVGQKLFIPESIIGRAFNEEKGMIWPAYGTISSTYGWRYHPILKKNTFHTGVDISAPEGTPVFAAESGVVEFVGTNGGYGLTVKIRSSSYTHMYAHLSKACVYPGQFVKKGQLIGRVGKTGLATGPHLHFEVQVRGQAVNPMNYLPTQIWVLKKEILGVGGE